MNSNLNNAKKDETTAAVAVTVFSQGEKKIEFPPRANKKYPISISERALREYIAKGGEVLVIPVEKGKMNDKKKSDKKANKEESLENSI